MVNNLNTKHKHEHKYKPMHNCMLSTIACRPTKYIFNKFICQNCRCCITFVVRVLNHVHSPGLELEIVLRRIFTIITIRNIFHSDESVL